MWTQTYEAMRVIPAEEKKEEVKEEIKEEKKVDSFNDLLIQEFGLEVYGMHFFASLGIHKKSCGLCDMAKFFWDIAIKTQDIKLKIKKFLLNAEVDFAYPQINEVKFDKSGNCFKFALDYENDRIKHLYEVVDKAPCSCTKGFVNKLIKEHMKIQHLISLAYKITEMSDDALLVQQSIYKLIYESEH